MPTTVFPVNMAATGVMSLSIIAICITSISHQRSSSAILPGTSISWYELSYCPERAGRSGGRPDRPAAGTNCGGQWGGRAHQDYCWDGPQIGCVGSVVY